MNNRYRAFGYRGFLTVAAGSGSSPVSVSNQTAKFGADTLSTNNGGRFRAIDDLGGFATITAITGGTLSASYEVNDTGVKRTSGTPTSDDGGTLEVTANDQAITLTLSVDADTYDVASDADIAAVIAVGTVTLSGKTLRARRNTIATAYTQFETANNSLKNKLFTDTFTITSEDTTSASTKSVFSQIEVRTSNFVVIDGIKGYNETVPPIAVVNGSGSTVAGRIYVQNCVVHANTLPTTGAYTTDYLLWPNYGITTLGGSSPPVNLSIINNEVFFVRDGILAECSGDLLEIKKNKVYFTYGDSFKLPQPASGAVASCVIEDNIAFGHVSLESDPSGIHADCFQITGNAANPDNWTGFEFRRNVGFHSGTRGDQPHFFFEDDMQIGTYLDGAIFEHNVCSTKALHAITVRDAKDIQAHGNVLLGDNDATGALASNLFLGDRQTSGTHIAKYNVAEAISITGTSTVEGNVILGLAGATIAYTTAFDATDFTPTTAAELLAMSVRKAAGPLDTAAYKMGSDSPYVVYYDFETPNTPSNILPWEIDPSSLFSVDDGDWWLFSKATALFSDAAGTTAAVDAGEVLNVTGQEANYDLTEATLTNGPTWDRGSPDTLTWLDADSSNLGFTHTNLVDGACSIGMAVRAHLVPPDTNNRLFDASTSVFYANVATDRASINVIRLHSGSNIGITFPVDLTVDRVVILTWNGGLNGTDIECFVDGSQVTHTGTPLNATGTPTATTNLHFGNRSNDSRPTDMVCTAAFVVDSELSAGEITEKSNWLAATQGRLL